MVHGQIGQNLPVEVDIVFFELAHEGRVGIAMLASSGIDALNPKCAKIALLLAAVSVGVLQSFFEGIFGYGKDVFPSTEIAFGLLQHFLATGA